VLNIIWISFFLIAFFTALFKLLILGDQQVFSEIIEAMFKLSKSAFDISLGLTGILSLWLGIMKIGEKSGFIEIITQSLTPLFSRLMPEVPKGHPALGAIVMNIAANALGLDNAATPLGIKAMQELQTLNHILEFPLELRQSHLNYFHRIFTTLTRDYLEYGNTIPDNIDRLEFLKNVDSLNQNSHDLEPMSYLHLKNVNFIRTKITHNIRCVDAYSTLNDRNAVWDNQVNINTPFDPLVDDYYHTVWLEEDIRGKDMIKAWVQEDDLTAEDCTGNLFLTPNILLDPYYTIPSIINHPDWQDQYIKSGKTLNRFPVGDIMDLDKVHWGELSEFKLEQIQLDNTILWRNISK